MVAFRMKKTLGIIVLLLLLCNISKAASPYGEGELQLTKGVVDYFIQYIRGKGNKSPEAFYVSTDGTWANYWYCSQGHCGSAHTSEDIKTCEKNSGGKKCKKFAFSRTIKWKNGINPARGKESRIKSKWSDEDIYAKLTELGFYNNNFIKKTTKTNSTDSTETSSTKSTELTSKLIKQLKDLKKLYDEGVLTKEEFTKAKKKILN